MHGQSTDHRRGVLVRFVIGAFALIGLLVGAGIAAVPAGASGSSVMLQSEPLRWGPSTDYSNTWTASKGTPIQMICWTDSQWYDGSNRWFEVRGSSPNFSYQEGYVPANSVGNQSSVGHC